VEVPRDRQIAVWRSVPSIAEATLTAPYQLDGRVSTLEERAQGAITSHSEGGEQAQSELERIAAYERMSVPISAMMTALRTRSTPGSWTRR
jgi:hypothetical protein